jgi:hypothetical protein
MILTALTMIHTFDVSVVSDVWIRKNNISPKNPTYESL